MRRLWELTGLRVVIALLVGAVLASGLWMWQIVVPHLREDHLFVDRLKAAYAAQAARQQAPRQVTPQPGQTPPETQK